MPTELTYEATARELATDQGVLRYHEAGEGPPASYEAGRADRAPSRHVQALPGR